MQRVLMVDRNRQPLMPCHPARARELLRKGKAAVLRRYPFTIILKERKGGTTQPITLKFDPGSWQTGIALVADCQRGKRVIWAAVLEHRGEQIHAAPLARSQQRRGRRIRKTRYRAARFDNRRRADRWLPPSLQSRLDNVRTWCGRLSRFASITSLARELARFDTQPMQNAEISGVEYQQGELAGYEVREYLLEKWGQMCACCGTTDTPLEIGHSVLKSRGGSDRVSNLTLACHACSQAKSDQTAAEFGHPDIQQQAKQSLKGVVVVNAPRWALYQRLQAIGRPLEVGTGGRTKYKRTQQGYPKAHWIDSACVGESGTAVWLAPNHIPLHIKATGHGRRQRCRLDAFGFPRAYAPRAKAYLGFQTGDIVKAVVPSGKFAGVHRGRVAIRYRPSFRLNGFDVHPKYLTRLHRADGYEYQKG